MAYVGLIEVGHVAKWKAFVRLKEIKPIEYLLEACYLID